MGFSIDKREGGEVEEVGFGLGYDER